MACIKTSSREKGEISIFALVSRLVGQSICAHARVRSFSKFGDHFPFPSLNVNIHIVTERASDRPNDDSLVAMQALQV